MLFLLAGCSSKKENKEELFAPQSYKEEYGNYEENLFFTFLSDEEKDIYIALDRYLGNYETKIPIFHSKVAEIENAYRALSAYEPKYYWLEDAINGRTYDIIKGAYNDQPIDFSVIDYPVSDTQIKEAKNDRKKIADIVSSLSKKLKGEDEQQTLLNIHDYLVANTAYVSESINNQDVRSVFFHHESVCAGYARSFQMLAKEAGIECYYISGDAVQRGNVFSGFHAWNLVKVNGSYYWVDVTWDDPDSGDLIGYRYFLIPDELINKDHIPRVKLKGGFPECSSYDLLPFDLIRVEKGSDPFTQLGKQWSGSDFSLIFEDSGDYDAFIAGMSSEETGRRLADVLLAQDDSRLYYYWTLKENKEVYFCFPD